MSNIHWLNWPAPCTVRACYTLRTHGDSSNPYGSFNVANHVGDNPSAVMRNRGQLLQTLQLTRVAWLHQTHSNIVVDAHNPNENSPIEADASFTRTNQVACCVLTADCLPVFFCDRAGQQVAIAHAGWRGLYRGILQKTVATFPNPNQVIAYLGPAIGPNAYEVGLDVFNSVFSSNSINDRELKRHFKAGAKKNKWLLDLYGLAASLLNAEGIGGVYGAKHCTYSEPKDFFSYRRDGVTGRMAHLIWKVDGSLPSEANS